MRSSSYPTRDAFDDFTAIRTSKNGKRRKNLQRLEPRVFQRYHEFLRNLTNLESVKARYWSDVCHNSLLHCYTSETAALSLSLDELERSTRPEPYRCPYCLMRQPKTWDHFLAKEDFPEFSTLSLNLVRACSVCNQKKLRSFTNAPRQVVNPYFDPIPNVPLLWCNASITPLDRLHLVYYIEQVPTVPPAIVDLFDRHFSSFDLQADMINEGATLVSTFINEILPKRVVPFTSNQMDQAISQKLDGLINYPTNSWEVATFEALGTCTAFVDYFNRLPSAPIDQPPRINRQDLLARLQQALSGGSSSV